MLSLTNDEVLVAKISPFDFFLSTQRVIFWQNHDDPFSPKGKGVATLGVSRIHEECHIKLSLPNSLANVR